MTLQETSTVEVAAAKSTLRRFWRGFVCSLSFLVLPMGRLCCGRWIKRMEPERLDRGLVLILPGMEGRSFLNVSLMAGLLDAGLPYAMEILDWTTGCCLLASIICALGAESSHRPPDRQSRGRVLPALSGTARMADRALGRWCDVPAGG